MNKLWPFSFYFLFFAAVASAFPFIVLYYQEAGFTGAQIGLLTGISPLVLLFATPLWTGLADSTHRHRLLMSLAILGGSITLLVYPMLQVFLPVFALTILLYFSLAPVTPFADSATLSMLADQKHLYSRVRLGGTIGYGLTALLAGAVVQNYGLRFAFWGSGTLLLLALVVSQKLVYGQLAADLPARGRVRILLANPHWLLFMILAFMGGFALAAFNNYLFPYMSELGADESTMGLAILVGTLSEIPTLFFANRLILRLKPYGLLILSMVVTGLRLLLFALSATPGLILLIQLLNGLTFPAMWVAGVSYADQNAPPGLGTTAQGLFSAVSLGMGTAVGGFIGGLLLERLGGRGLYWVFGWAVLAIVALVVVLHKRLPAQQVTAPTLAVD